MSEVRRGPDDDPSLSNDEIIAQRTAWFDRYTSQTNVITAAGESLYSCPCCGHQTLSERGSYEICKECGWEDDGQDNHDSHTVRGGPNGNLSLDMARDNYGSEGGNPKTHSPPTESR